jgi:hypothetical protein
MVLIKIIQLAKRSGIDMLTTFNKKVRLLVEIKTEDVSKTVLNKDIHQAHFCINAKIKHDYAIDNKPLFDFHSFYSLMTCLYLIILLL